MQGTQTFDFVLKLSFQLQPQLRKLLFFSGYECICLIKAITSMAVEAYCLEHGRMYFTTVRRSFAGSMDAIRIWAPDCAPGPTMCVLPASAAKYVILVFTLSAQGHERSFS